MYYFVNRGDTNSYVAGGLSLGVTYVVTLSTLQISGELPQIGFVNVTTGRNEILCIFNTFLFN